MGPPLQLRKPETSYPLEKALARFSTRYGDWRVPFLRNSLLLSILEFLASILEGKRDQFKSLAAECEIEIWCFISFENSQYGLALDHALLKRLVDIPVALVFDIYSGSSPSATGKR